MQVTASQLDALLQGAEMTDHREVLTEQAQEMIAALEHISQSREVRELIERLEEDGAYPQTVIQLEED